MAGRVLIRYVWFDNVVVIDVSCGGMVAKKQRSEGTPLTPFHDLQLNHNMGE